jgi:Tol biopolymer transport system component
MRIVKVIAVALVTGAVLAPVAAASFPGTNGKIFFESNRDAFGVDFDLFSMNPDGSGVTNLTRTPTVNEIDISPSADGTRIVFTSFVGISTELFVANADGSAPQQLTNDAANEFAPRFSPDGSKIIFTSANGQSDVFVMNADGTNPVNLTNSPAADDEDGAFSPDGSKIIFQSDRDDGAGKDDVFTMNADGSNPVNLTGPSGFFDGDGDFSPDGQKIAFRSRRNGSNQIFLMDANGNNETQLTQGALNDSSPTFAPDGTKIAFDRGNSGDEQTTLMNPDGSGQQQIAVLIPSTNELPQWGRAPLQIALDGKRKQVAGKLKANVACSTPCNVRVFANGKAGKKFRSQTANKDLPGGVSAGIRVKFKKKVLKRIDDRKGSGGFTAIASDPFATVTATKGLKLKP